MDSFAYSATAHFSSPLEECAQRQQEIYWRVRMQKTLERLEREARRMLQLEAALSRFAEGYYRAVGAYAERLAALEARLTPPAASAIAPPAMSDVHAQRDMLQTRQRELKTRYRALAKEIHPDRAPVVEGMGTKAECMQVLNDAYAQGDLPILLRLEAEMLLTREMAAHLPLETRLREVERAADTYAAGYRQLLHSPLNALMLRQLSAQLAGRDWVEAVVHRVQRAIAHSEQALEAAAIAAIDDGRVAAHAA